MSQYSKSFNISTSSAPQEVEHIPEILWFLIDRVAREEFTQTGSRSSRQSVWVSLVYGSKQGEGEDGRWTRFPECSARVKRTLPRWSGLDPAPRGNIESQDVLLCHPGLADLLVMNMLPTAIHARTRSTENMYGQQSCTAISIPKYVT